MKSFPEQLIRDLDWGHMTEQILHLTLEIIYLLTGEHYGPVSKPRGPPTSSLTRHRLNDKKILAVTQKISELLTGEVPIRCQDVSVYFSMEEWEYLEGHKDLYKDIVMMEHKPPLTSLELPKASKTPEDLDSKVLGFSSDDQTLKSTDPNNHIALGSTLHEGLLQNQSRTLPGPSARSIKEESEDDDVIITEILISREPSRMKCSINSIQSESMVHERHNGGLQPSRTHNGSFENFVKVRETEQKRTYKCQQCRKSFLSDSELSKHQSVHAKSQALICTVCSKCFFTQSDLSDHMQSHITAKTTYNMPFDPASVLFSEITSTNKPFRCHYCGANFSGTLELATHQLIHFKNPYPCTECGRNFLSKSGLVTHQKTHSKHFDCPVCGKSFLSRSNLLLHQEVHVRSTPEVSFDRDSHITEHRVEELFSCTECGEIYDSRVAFLQHQQQHLCANKYTCSECGKQFNRKSRLSLHRRVIHQGSLSYACPDCGKGFSCHSEMARHIRVHTGEQPYSCTQCGKCFSFKSALVRHQRIHNGNSPHVCTMCGKGFSCNSALQRHRSIHFKDSFLL